MVATVDTAELEAKVKEMYRHVAQEPGGDYHFELGESLALRVGYDADRLRNVPAGAVESFAGVGFFFDLANLTSGETVVDLGSGSGMDALYAADYVGPSGRVFGIDFTLEQLEKARKLGGSAAVRVSATGPNSCSTVAGVSSETMSSSGATVSSSSGAARSSWPVKTSSRSALSSIARRRYASDERWGSASTCRSSTRAITTRRPMSP